jgi:Hsp70 protein
VVAVAVGVPSWRIAVDFGTTATVAAVSVAGGPAVLLELERDSTRMPSAVFLEKDGSLAVGRRAAHQAMIDPARFQPTPKREIGRPFITFGDQRIATMDVIAAVLSRVLVTAFGERGARPPEVIALTHPVRWGAERTRVLADALVAAAGSLPGQVIDAGLPAPVAAAAAELPGPVLVPEPVAAAWHYAAGYDLPPGAALAVYDLGGGTFDTAVVIRGAGGGFEVRADGGLADLGGEDFDAELLAFCGARLAGAHPGRWAAIVDPGTDQGARTDRRRLAEYVQAAKEDLSTRMRTSCRLLDNPPAETLLERQDLERLIEPHLRRSLDELAGTIARAGLTPAALAGLYLAGGSSRIPKVADLLKDRLGITPTPLDDPKAVVARGALAAAGPPATSHHDGGGGNSKDHAPTRTPPAQAAQPAAPAAAPAQHQPGPGHTGQLKAELLRDITLPPGLREVSLSDDLSRIATLVEIPGGEAVTIIDASTGRSFTWAPKGWARVWNRFRGIDIAGGGAPFCVYTDSWTVLVLDAATGGRLTKITHPGYTSKDAFFSAKLTFDGNRLITDGNRQVCVWDTATGRQVLTVPRGFAALSRGRLAVKAKDERAHVWDVTTGRQLATVTHPGLNYLWLSADDTRLATYGAGGLRVWDAADGRQLTTVHSFRTPSFASHSSLSADGTRLACWGGDKREEVHIWDIAAGRELLTFSADLPPKRRFSGALNGDPTEDVAFSPDGSRLATNPRVWDVSSGSQPLTLPRSAAGRRVWFGSDSKVLALADAHQVQFWRLSAGA